tara:strand:+ start:379 stop:975 length:597 start_codon:yes stop_codon:yes gene_type:complete
MDDIVKNSLKKWPNVPNCYGWLSLDRRGVFRIKNKSGNGEDTLGERIEHKALLDFIYRNYEKDKRGAWFFQNGPQKVFVELETTPFIARSDPEYGFILHNKIPLSQILKVFLTRKGELVLGNKDYVAMVDDRDLAYCLNLFRFNQNFIKDEELLKWLTNPFGKLQIKIKNDLVNIERTDLEEIKKKFNFVSKPELIKA